MTPEKLVKTAVVKMLVELGAWYCFPATGGYGRSGVPDILVCLNGLFVAIECKANGGKPTALQERELRAVNAANGFALVIGSVDDVPLLRERLTSYRNLLKST